MKMSFVPPEELKTLSLEELTMQLRWRCTTLHILEAPETANKFLRAQGVSPDHVDIKSYCMWQRRWLEAATKIAKERGINAEELELLTPQEWSQLNNDGGKRYGYEEVVLQDIQVEDRAVWLRKLTDFLLGKLETPQHYPLWVEFFGPNKELLCSFKFDKVEDLRGEIAICQGRLRKLEERPV